MKIGFIKKLLLGGATTLGFIGFASPAAFAWSGNNGDSYSNNNSYANSYSNRDDNNDCPSNSYNWEQSRGNSNWGNESYGNSYNSNSNGCQRDHSASYSSYGQNGCENDGYQSD